MTSSVDMEDDISKVTFNLREHELGHKKFGEEIRNFGKIKLGDPSEARKFADEFVHNTTSVLSENPLRCKKYLFVAASTLISRYAIEGGLQQELAYTLSDLYIQRMDRCNSVEEIGYIYEEMFIDFASRVNKVKTSRAFSEKINKSIDYIYYNIHKRLTVAEISRHAGLSTAYLSVLFKKETGLAVSDFIKEERIKTAKNLLHYTDFSYTDISNYLAFSSHSHFIQVFKKETGMTPSEYRREFARQAVTLE